MTGSDPRRMLDEVGDGTADETERALLRAARGYRPPARARKRALVALGLGGAFSLSQLAAGAAATVAAKPWIAAGVLATAVVGGGVGVAVTTKARAVRPAVTAPSGSSTAPSRPVAPAVTAPVETPPAVVAPESPVAQPPAPQAARRMAPLPRPAVPLEATPLPTAPLEPPPPAEAPPQLAPPPAAATPSSPSIADEVSRLRRASAALSTGQIPAASAALDAYALAHPTGTMRLEAAVLRIELHARRGEAAEARRAAEAFLSAHPRSVLAPRVRAVLQAHRP